MTDISKSANGKMKNPFLSPDEQSPGLTDSHLHAFKGRQKFCN